MSQSGYTPILTYGSTTASNVPLAANLTTSSSGVELAINAADGKLFYKDNLGVVQVLASKGSGTIGGSNTQVQYNSSGSLAGSANLTFDGTTLTAAGLSGPHNGTVGATTPNTGAFTTLTTSSTVTINGGTANGVAYLNGSKVLTTGSALTFDGSTLGVATTAGNMALFNSTAANGGYLTIQRSGVSKGYIGSAAQLSGGSNDDFTVRAESNLIFSLIASEQMRLTSTGLGIGTSSPGTKLDVNGTARIRAGNTLYFQNATADANGTITASGGAGSSDLAINAGGGNVGIGTSSPAYKVDASGQVRALESGTGSGDGGLIGSTAGANGNAGVLFQTNATSRWNLTTSGTNGANLRFYNYTLGSTVATFDSSGNLGIGTTSPSTVGVSGYTRLVLGAGGSATDGLTIVPSGTGGVQFTDAANVKKGYLQWDSSTGALTFGTAATERARIDSSGNLLVGTTSTFSAAKMTIQGNATYAASILGTAGNTTSNCLFLGLGGNRSTDTTYSVINYVDTDGTGTARFRVYGNGNVVNTNNSYGAISDAKLKENIVDATPKLDKLLQVRVVNYNLIGEPDNKQLGVVAQELEQIFPAMVSQSPDLDADGNDLGTTTKSVKYSVFVPMLIKAMQEQQALIESLTARLNALENK